MSAGNIQFRQVDLSHRETLKALLTEASFDSVIHLAAQPGVRLPKTQYWKYIQNNVVAFENIISASVDSGVGNFLYASSSSVYGNSVDFPFSEKEKALTPVSFYGATKLANEILTPSVIRGSETKARGLRFFTVYGPWGRPDMAYFRLLANAITGVPFSIFGDGKIMRDFTFIDDVVDSIIDLDNELRGRSSAFTDIVNIGGGKPYSLMDMISEIDSQVPLQGKIDNKDFNLNDVESTNADATYLRSLIGKTPATSLHEGIKRSIEWAESSHARGQLGEWVSSVG
jgi:UDP-glucuronate 4-epimerase